MTPTQPAPPPFRPSGQRDTAAGPRGVHRHQRGRRRVLVAVAAAVVLAVLVVVWSAGYDRSSLQRVGGRGYRFSVPAGWHRLTNTGVEVSNGVLIEGAPSKGSASRIQVVSGGDEGYGLTYWAGNRRQVDQEQADVSDPALHPIGGFEQLRVAGAPAMAFEATGRLADGTLVHERHVVCIWRGFLYEIMYFTSEQAFVADRPALQQVLATWSWT